VPSGPDWLLIDGSSLIFRAFFGVPNTVRAPDGRLVNGVRGFLDTLARLIFARRPQRLAVASDEDWRPQHRVDLIPSYKAHRVAEPIPPALDRQMPLIAAVLDALGVDFVGAPTLEAEDVIASWVERLEGARIEIVSGDRDLFALIRDPLVRVLYPEKGGLAEVDEAEVKRRYGIPGRLYADFAVLRGDPSDGLPGLPGVGAKTAATLVNKYNGVHGLLEAGRLSETDADYVRKALEVVKPGSAVPVPVPPGRREKYPDDTAKLVALSEELGLDSSLEKLLQALGTSVR
jgi:5'-3' exonuclease